MTWLDEEDGRLNPDTVAAKEFAGTRGLRRGLDPDEVRQYLTWVAAGIRGLMTAYADQWEYAQRLEKQVMGRADPGQVLVLRGGDANRQAIRILSEAQQTADRVIGDAQDYAGQLMSDAEKCWHEMVDDAAERAEQTLARAEEQGRQAEEAARAAGPPPPQAADERLAAAMRAASLEAKVEVCLGDLHGQIIESVVAAIDDWREQQKVTAPVAASPAPAVTSSQQEGRP